jgi:isoquinoline 1-oxidoreductase beta subunit
MSLTRRAFIKTSALAATGLVIGVEFSVGVAAETAAVFEPNAYISITPDDVVRLWITRSEMGQGVRTTLSMMLAEELEVNWPSVHLEQAITGMRFKGIRLRTSGSGSTVGTYNSMRTAGATAREMLIAAAAEKWHVQPSACRAEKGAVVNKATGRKLSYGQLAAAASRQKVPANPSLKSPKDFRVIGKPTRRVDSKAIVTGQAVYGLDARVPDMLFAVMERCPCIGGKVASFDASKALAVAGVRHLVPITSGIATGVAVAADHTWAAMKGREALKVEWDLGPNQNFDSDQFLQEEIEASRSTDGYYVRDDGDAAKALGAAAMILDAVYITPFQAHAPVETMNCLADVRKASCEIWAPTQCPDEARNEAAKMLGFPPESVRVHVTLIGGGFGRRLFADYVYEAVELSRAIAKPVQLMWTRTEDMQCGYFHPCGVERVAGGLDTEGKPIAWRQTSVGSNLSMYPLPTEAQRKNPRFYFDDEMPWGSFDNPYNFPHLKADYFPVNSPIPTGPWRAVFYPSRVFARESFLDEMAHAARQDPIEFRLRLLQPGDILRVGNQKIDRGRLIRVLQVVAEQSNWKNPLRGTKDRLWGRGIACNVYDEDCYIAQVAEVSVGRETHDVRVHRIVCSVDCGLVVNPLGLEGQVESGIIWGLSATISGKIDFKKGSAVQSNFTDFEVIRTKEAPAIETHIVASDHPPGGFGETAVPPVAPAVTNAIFAATGVRIRRLPVNLASNQPLATGPAQSHSTDNFRNIDL